MSALVVKRPWKLFDFGGYQIGAAADGEAVCTMWGDREEAIANASYLTEAVNAYDTLRAENERLRKIAHDLTDAITKVRPLGGSELFRRFDDQTYFADAAYCGAAIEEMKRELHEARKDAVRAKRCPALSEAQP